MINGMNRPMTAEEKRWLNRLQRTLNAQPESLMMYCHGGTTTALDHAKSRAADEFSFRDAIIDDAPSIKTPQWIAGDF
jgi:predicted alpha/beta hydrolase family esterase